ncbi:heparan-alpha-glucosaminide N-acetyltransferase domain-containing protein [Curtobacterium sp. MCBD17_032]|uniref:heparan-alpha-glucosaminide N-acetyltransferase domain-containing protein n=1 Tax=Curtobacterium sp. MCBD17_032 TaxID=2175659 RepID=UPI0011B3B1A1|nr:heparan-alpha-glucosaminide N-acetyltransferase domain-containing protein [Curtobacterium sp. MCBD17_032]
MTGTRPAPRTGVPGAPSSGRLVGVDVARAVALLGMMAAHVGDVAEQVDWADPTSWSAVVNGRSAALFAVLAGVSIGLVSGREAPPGPPTIGRVRARLALRAVVVVAVGFVLMALGTPVYVVLPTYGALFLLALPVLRWRSWALLVLAAACALASAPVVVAVLPAYADAGMTGVQLGLVYPVVTFATYVFVGLAVARSRAGATGTDTLRQVALFVTGAVVAAAAYVIGAVAAPVPADTTGAFPGVPFVPAGSDTAQAVAQVFLSPRDHSSSIVDVVGTAAVAVAVIALCRLVFDGHGPAVARVAFPLAAVGSMPLSVYALHLVVIAAWPDLPHGPTTWWAFTVGAVLFAMVWRRFLGRGPLERLTAAVASAVPLRPDGERSGVRS